MISERNTIVKIDCRTDGRGSISIVAESKIDKIIAEIFGNRIFLVIYL